MMKKKSQYEIKSLKFEIKSVIREKVNFETKKSAMRNMSCIEIKSQILR